MKLGTINSHILFDGILLEDLKENLLRRGLDPDLVSIILQVTSKDIYANWLANVIEEIHIEGGREDHWFEMKGSVVASTVTQVKRTLEKYDDLKKRGKFLGYKDINKYKIYPMLADDVKKSEKSSEDYKKILERSLDIVNSTDNYLLGRAISIEDAMVIANAWGVRGEPSSWCVKRSDCAKSYMQNKDGLYFILDKKGKRIGLSDGNFVEVKNFKNEDLPVDSELADLLSVIIDITLPPENMSAGLIRIRATLAWELVRRMMLAKNMSRTPALEKILAGHAEVAYKYALYILKGRWDGPHAQQAERLIAIQPYSALRYAMDVIEGQWTGPNADLAESAINTDRSYANDYDSFLRKIGAIEKDDLLPF